MTRCPLLWLDIILGNHMEDVKNVRALDHVAYMLRKSAEGSAGLE